MNILGDFMETVPNVLINSFRFATILRDKCRTNPQLVS